MTIDRETLAAYADGELEPEEAARVEAALIADPALAGEIAAHRALRTTLGAHFRPIAELPVPDRLTSLLGSSDNVVDLAAKRRQRDQAVKAPKGKMSQPTRWMMGGAIAAMLVVGLFLSVPQPQPSGDADIRSENGALIADGKLDKALTTQLAADQGGASTRILLSFKANDGRFCRGFATDALAGIACRGGDGWSIERTQAVPAENRADYRQAGSPATAMIAAAQDMAAGGALDASGERAARDTGWGR